MALHLKSSLHLNSNLCEIFWVDYYPECYNWPPIGTPKIEGPTNMEADIEYEFNFSAVDPEKEEIYYNISWGDGNYSGWFGPYNSSEKVKITHIWNVEGSYKVRFKTKNENGVESYWMPKEETNNQIDNRPIIGFLKRLTSYFFR
jgi:hypothetical protein